MTTAEVQPEEPHVNPMVHLIAPLVAFGATMIVRKVMNSSYRKVTGTQPPGAHDEQVSFARAVMWAAATAATAAVVEVAVYRITTKSVRQR
jgi:hypothetical protein